MFKNIFKNKKADLNAELAGQMLQNVFDVCDVKPNTIPLEELKSYSNYRQDRYVIQKIILVVIIIIFLALPVMFIGPSIEKIKPSEEGNRPSYEVTVSSLLPVTSIHATINGEELPLYEKSKNVYSIEPNNAGTMTVRVETLNGQWVTEDVTVNNIDRTSPVITGTETKDGYVYVHVHDEDSEIAWKDIYAITAKGEMLSPDKYDTAAGWVRFKDPKSNITVFISDTSDNLIQLAITLSSDKDAQADETATEE